MEGYSGFKIDYKKDWQAILYKAFFPPAKEKGKLVRSLSLFSDMA